MKTRWLIGCLALLLLISLLSGCGGLHDSSQIYAYNEITHTDISIPLEVHNTAYTGSFTHFTSPLDFNEMMRELRTKKVIRSVDNCFPYLCLQTDNGEFYLKYADVTDEYHYELFAEVGRATDFGENIYVPFHMLTDYPNAAYPACATPFEGDVYYNSQKYNIDDFAAYYEDKGIYSVEKLSESPTLLITDKTNGYAFVVKAFDDGEYGMFVLAEEHGNDKNNSEN